MAARHPDRRRHRGRQLYRHLPEPVIGHARHALHPRCTKREPLGRGGEGRQSEIRWPWPSEQTVSFGVRPSHQPPAAVPWHSLSSPESRRQRDRTPQCCVASGSSRAPPAYALGCSRRFPCACGDRPLTVSSGRLSEEHAPRGGGIYHRCQIERAGTDGPPPRKRGWGHRVDHLVSSGSFPARAHGGAPKTSSRRRRSSPVPPARAGM